MSEGDPRVRAERYEVRGDTLWALVRQEPDGLSWQPVVEVRELLAQAARLTVLETAAISWMDGEPGWPCGCGQDVNKAGVSVTFYDRCERHTKQAARLEELEQQERKGQRVFEAVVYAFEGKPVPSDLEEHGMVRRARKHREAAGVGPTLFQSGPVTLHSGAVSDFKIDCDALTDEDWKCLSFMVADRVGRFSAVEGVPRGGLRLARELAPHVSSDGPLLIVDDVLTTGASMEAQRAGREAIGVVIFARGPCPSWVTPLFTLSGVGVGPTEALRQLVKELDDLDAIADDDSQYDRGMRCVTDHLRDWLAALSGRPTSPQEE